jgi:hypothetical protein
MASPDFASFLLTALYAACNICVLVLRDDEETHMFPSLMYITIVVGDIFSID